MNNKTIGIGLLIIGVIMMIVSISADLTGLGQDPLNFGWKQILGAMAGLVVINVGVWVLIIRKMKSEEQKVSNDQTKEETDEIL